MLSSLRAVTRPVRRNLFQPLWKTLTTVLLIALPVGFISGFALWNTSSEHYGTASYDIDRVTYYGGECFQSGDLTMHSCTEELDASATNRAEAASALNKALPDGVEATKVQFRSTNVTAGTSTATTRITSVPGNALAQTFSLPANVSPATGEILLNRSTAKQLGAKPGDQVQVQVRSADGEVPVGKSTTMTVKSIAPGMTSYVSDKLTVDSSNEDSRAYDSMSFAVVGDSPMSWDDALAFNKAGFVVTSPSLSKEAAPESYVQRYEDNTEDFSPEPTYNVTTSDVAGKLFGTLALATAILLLLVFISPVFALSLTKHTRDFALLSTQGATRRQIHFAGLSFGFFTGLLGTLLGLIAGIAIAFAWWKSEFPLWSLVVPWRAWAITAGITVAAAVGASLIPAWIIARGSLSAALQGYTPERIVRWQRWMLIGPMGTVVTSILLALQRNQYPSVPYSSEYNSSFEISAFLLFFVALSAPAVTFAASRLAVRSNATALWNSGRALTRQSAHTIPAVATMLCIGVIATTVGIEARTSNELRAHLDHSVAPTGQVGIQTATPSTASHEDALKELQALRPTSTAHTMDAIFGPTDNVNSEVSIELEPLEECKQITSIEYGGVADTRTIDAATAERCWSTLNRNYVRTPWEAYGLDAMIVDSPEQLDLFAFDSPELKEQAKRAIGQGALLLPQKEPTIDGKRELHLAVEGSKIETKEVRAVSVLPNLLDSPLIVSKKLADELGLKPNHRVSAVQFDSRLTNAEIELLRDHPQLPSAKYHIGSSDEFRAANRISLAAAGVMGLVSLISILLIIALGYRRIRREHATYDALGAAPGFNAKVAGLQTWLTSSAALLTAWAGTHIMSLLFASGDAQSAAGDVIAVGNRSLISPDWILLGASILLPVLFGVVAWAIYSRGGSITENHPQVHPRG